MTILTAGTLGPIVAVSTVAAAEIGATTVVAATSVSTATAVVAASGTAIVSTSSYIIPAICIINPWFCIGVAVGAEEIYESHSLNNYAGDSLLGVSAIDGIL
jgi:hypothetical protein